MTKRTRKSRAKAPDTVPTPPPAPKAPETPAIPAWATLYRENLEAIRVFYRRSETAGQELGHFILLEMAAADSISALDAAIAGKKWQPARR